MGACRKTKAEHETAKGTSQPSSEPDADHPTHLVQLGPGHILLVIGEDGVRPALQHCIRSPAPRTRQGQLREAGRKEPQPHPPYPVPCSYSPLRGTGKTEPPSLSQGTYVLARWVVKTYTNCEGGFPETPPAPAPGPSGRSPGGGPCWAPGALLSLRGSWAVWPGPSCGAAIAGSATLQSAEREGKGVSSPDARQSVGTSTQGCSLPQRQHPQALQWYSLVFTLSCPSPVFAQNGKSDSQWRTETKVWPSLPCYSVPGTLWDFCRSEGVKSTPPPQEKSTHSFIEEQTPTFTEEVSAESGFEPTVVKQSLLALL